MNVDMILITEILPQVNENGVVIWWYAFVIDNARTAIMRLWDPIEPTTIDRYNSQCCPSTIPDSIYLDIILPI